jgi:hypothetical protein
MQVLFYKGPETFFGRLVRWKTGSPYSHCVLRFESGIRFQSNWSILTEFYYGSDGISWNVREWDAIEVTGGDEQAVQTWCRGEVGTSYDWFGLIFCQVFPWGWRNPTKWFCSEICAAALQAGRYPAADGIKPWYQSPAKLAKALLLGGGKLVEPG